jgi:hypothetical protein
MQEFKDTVSKVFEDLIVSGQIKATDEEVKNYKLMLTDIQSKYAFVRDGRFYKNIHPHVLKNVKL